MAAIEPPIKLQGMYGSPYTSAGTTSLPPTALSLYR